MALSTPDSTLPLSYTLSVYPMPLCFGTMESHDKGNTRQSNFLRSFRISRQEGSREKEGGAEKDGEEERMRRKGEEKGEEQGEKGREEKTGGEGRKDMRGRKKREDGTGRGRVETRINRGRERRRRKEEKAEEGGRREEDVQIIPCKDMCRTTLIPPTKSLFLKMSPPPHSTKLYIKPSPHSLLKDMPDSNCSNPQGKSGCLYSMPLQFP